MNLVIKDVLPQKGKEADTITDTEYADNLALPHKNASCVTWIKQQEALDFT